MGKEKKVSRAFEWRESLETRLMRVCGGAMERASWSTCRRTGAWIGLAMFGAVRGRRETSIQNVQLAFPDLSEAAARQIARRSAQNFGMMFCEFLHLRAASKEQVAQYCELDAPEHISNALNGGKGVIILTAHLGNWEVMGARLAQEFPLTVVARPTSNSGVESHIKAVRHAGGLEIISKYDTGRAAISTLRQNRALGILPDQHGGPDGLLLPMFGHPTRFIAAVARMSVMTGAPIVPCFGARRSPWLRDGRILTNISPGWTVAPPTVGKQKLSTEERDQLVREGTQRVIATIEDAVRRYPEQWLWMHRRWRSADARDAERELTSVSKTEYSPASA